MDKLIAVFDSENQVEVERELRRQEKAAKRYVNSKVRSQDDVDWDETKQEAEPCPNPDCGHYYTMGIESRNEVDEANDALKAEHQQLTRQYNDLPAAQKKEKKKPAKKKTMTQTIACYCFRMNCLLQASGGTCPSCTNMHIAGESNFVMENGRRKCLCDICACSCCVTFPRNRRYEVALALQTEKTKTKDVIDVDSPSNTISILGSVIMSGVHNGLAIARQRKPEGTHEEIAHDTSAFALQGLLGSTQFRSAKAVKDL